MSRPRVSEAPSKRLKICGEGRGKSARQSSRSDARIVRREASTHHVVILLEPRGEGPPSGEIGRESRAEVHEVLVLDLLAGHHVQSRLDQLRVQCPREREHGSDLGRRIGGLLVHLANLLPVLAVAVLDDETEDRAAEVGLDGLLVSGGELGKGLLGMLNDGLVTSASGGVEGVSAEGPDRGRVGRGELEAETVDERAEEGALQREDALADRLGLLPPDAGEIIKGLGRAKDN